MNCKELIKQLGYVDNPAFLQGERFKEHLGYSFFFSQAQKEDHCKLRGVYVLAGLEDQISKTSITPVVYVCEADDENEASKIHRRVWNQNTVPFLIVVTPKNIRLYSGFQYDQNTSDDQQVLKVAKNTEEILDGLSAFTSKAIDSGEIWDKWKITNEKRVDRHLLKNLKKLTEVLIGTDYKLPLEDAHTLIGKYIYLKYLRDRDILSDRKLSKEGFNESDIFGRIAKKGKLYLLEKYLNRFLNGSVFPLPNKNRILAKHVQKVASTFKGDDPQSNQQVLFDLYDFSYVPIETLSVVYQQFLHQKDEGRDKGAYYTPIHLVNFILDELNAKGPLKEGMKVFDPSCGSGAFLVQCYRRFVERIIREEKQKLNPSDLRRLLVDHIFGLDADEEACRVAELSLSLTLLDYINPPDLSKTNFKLPNLHNKNIFYCKGGFFDEEDVWTRNIPSGGYEWIIGNPPWKNIDKKKNTEKYDIKAIEWINKHKEKHPVDNYQIAEAFVWKVSGILSKNGQCGLLMPAMTLFKTQGRKFRSEFFATIEVWQVVNFANLRHLLFEGATNPAAAFFFSGRKEWDKSEHYITAYSPFAVEQSSQLSPEENSRKLWTVFINSSAIKDIPVSAVVDGSAVPWKMAMWGTNRDQLLINKIARKYSTLDDYAKRNKLSISEGLQLRVANNDSKRLELVNEVRGQELLVMSKLKGSNNIHSFDELDYFDKITSQGNIYTREGRKDLPLSICTPPHILIDASRRFVVYSEKYFVIPARQIGIAGEESQAPLLKALSVYLKSDYFQYQQWLTSVAWGIERDRPNFDDLKKLPIPLSQLAGEELAIWAILHDEIVTAEKIERNGKDPTLWDFPKPSSLPDMNSLLRQMNEMVYKLLAISKKQQWLIEDLLNVRMKLNEGNIANEAIQPANGKELAEYAQIFQDELDLFLDHTGEKKTHQLKAYYADRSVVIEVEHLQHVLQSQPEIIEVKDNESRRIFNELQDKLTEKKSQWMYFTRGLRIYEGRRTYIFKPRQRLYWLKSQALADADEFIADKVGAKEE